MEPGETGDRSEVESLRARVRELEDDYADAVYANLRLVMWLKKHSIRVPDPGKLGQMYPKRRFSYLWNK